ncbi:KdsC family phosphatase [Chryseosolibacter indicus]|uniref:HAD-IIIA family hydrolase n=1 Tax=Chryseosolibacter indicus TaxID=2782351 RepID=A0ABS5VTW7_9BACT|nr:HAD-IIIA family hydrolase [Chryseosolibacter indicus]MBT1704865.1 HAD-IIIA family hydrolase [Chryseosolibacter indicus]
METTLPRYSKDQVKKASLIKAIFFDVDGVLTDGRINYDDSGREIKSFNVKDGLIISYLKKAGIITGAISGRDSPAVARRCAELKIDFCHQGIIDKASTFEKLMKHYKLKTKEVVFIGDDINDLPVLRMAGFSVCPADTYDYIKEQVDLVTYAKGGSGVLREVGDLVLASKGILEKIVKGEGYTFKVTN